MVKIKKEIYFRVDSVFNLTNKKRDHKWNKKKNKKPGGQCVFLVDTQVHTVSGVAVRPPHLCKYFSIFFRSAFFTACRWISGNGVFTVCSLYSDPGVVFLVWIFFAQKFFHLVQAPPRENPCAATPSRPAQRAGWQHPLCQLVSVNEQLAHRIHSPIVDTRPQHQRLPLWNIHRPNQFLQQYHTQFGSVPSCWIYSGLLWLRRKLGQL